MTNKEIGELRRRMKPDRTNLTAVYGCYVASSGEVLSTFREPFGLMAEEDKEKYLAIFRRALSGTPDRNLLDLSFSTKQVADSDEHRLLMSLRDSGELEQNANKIVFLWKIDSDTGTIGVKVAKNRRGRTGIVQMGFDGSHMRFTELTEDYIRAVKKRGWRNEGA